MRLIFTLFCFLPFLLTAQYEKGNVYLSGTAQVEAGRQSTVVGDDHRPEWGGRVGYFLFDRFMVGGNPFAGSLFGRYYQPIGKSGRLAAFAELNVGDFYSGFDALSYEPALGLEYELAPGVLFSGKVKQTFANRRSSYTTLEFGMNTVMGKSYKLSDPANLLRRGSIFVDPQIGTISFSEPGQNVNFLSYDLHFGGGIMLTDRLALDGSISLSRSRTDFEFREDTYQRNAFSADIGLRYLLKETGRFRPYLGAGLSLETRRWKASLPQSPERNFDNFDTSVAPYAKAGFLYFLTDRVALDVAGEYTFGRHASNSNLGLGVGVKVFLGKKK